MRRWSWHGFLSAWFYGAALSGAALSCLITCYSLWVPLHLLWAVSVIAAGIGALLWLLPGRKYSLTLAALLLGLLVWWDWTAVAGGFCRVLETVTDTYSMSYPVEAICWMEGSQGSQTVFFALLDALLAVFTAVMVARRKAVWPLLLVLGPCLGCCLVVVDVLPAMWALLLLLAVGLLLLLTQSARRDSAVGGARLTLILAVPAALLVCLPAWLVQPSTYERADWPDTLQENLNGALERLMDVKVVQNKGYRRPELTLGLSRDWGAESKRLNLSALGTRRTVGYRVMTVTCSESGALYLRGASLSNYQNSTWMEQDGLQAWRMQSPDAEPAGNVEIRTENVNDLIYVPYYPAGTAQYLDDQSGEHGVISMGMRSGEGDISNGMGTKTYTIGYRSEPPGQDPAYAQTVYATCLSLPEQTRMGLLALAEKAGLTELPVEERPQAVADYVRGQAEYSLTPKRMYGDGDFAVWFLTEERRGYCVHFATAAALMLRALDIPARYVTGYVIMAEEGQEVRVTDGEAHAWVEYFVDDYGWIPLEATPAAGIEALASQQQGQGDELEPLAPVRGHMTWAQPSVPEQQDPVAEPAAPAEPVAPAEQQVQKERLGWVPRLLVAMSATVFAGVGLLEITRLTRVTLRRRKLRRGSPNERALEAWQQLVRLAQHAEQSLSPELAQLAQKARFSQHTLTDEEMRPLMLRRVELVRDLRVERQLLRWIQIRWIWADY